MSMLSRSGTMVRKKRRTSSKRGTTSEVPKRTFGKPPVVAGPILASPFSPPTDEGLPPSDDALPTITSAPESQVASPTAKETLPESDMYQYTGSHSYMPTKSVSCHLEIDLLGNEITKTQIRCKTSGSRDSLSHDNVKPVSVDNSKKRSSSGSQVSRLDKRRN